MSSKEKIIPGTPDACASCPAYSSEGLKRLGVKMDESDYVVALAGNPNTGKSTVFNSLTGLRQHTGNWPGKTVSRAEGAFSLDGAKYKIVDLPGTYSLLATSLDEEIARDFILFGKPDVTIVVVDATRLERNLNLVLQVQEITNHVIVACNLMDEAKRHGLVVDTRSLARDLGVPVIPMSARKNEGVPELLSTIAQMAKGQIESKPFRVKYETPQIKHAIDEVTEQIHKDYPDIPNPRWVAVRVLDGDAKIIEALRSGELGDLNRGDTSDRSHQIQVIGHQ
ncbi:FeoB small GTPase domain-containing protein [Spirochaeta cellobiosiphila]|uniref:FeoB small GTPase domain-containing protein n=1 Tax=Spirochaeta cellobiosiphila TaxID=504483 RepID=UPI0004147516|nr:FeoB small GTPase domain-containing protein [Spirochaeta cellobiosiphila]